MLRMDIEKAGIDYVWKYWDRYIKCGINADELARRCCSGLIINDNQIKELLDKGVNAETVFELSKSWLDYNNGWPERWSKTFRILHKYGLSSKSIDKWLKSHVSEDLLYDIIEERPGVWKRLGIRAEDYDEQWIGYFGKDFLGPYGLEKLPKTISRQKFLDYYSIKKADESQ